MMKYHSGLLRLCEEYEAYVSKLLTSVQILYRRGVLRNVYHEVRTHGIPRGISQVMDVTESF